MDKSELNDRIDAFWEWFTLNRTILEAVVAGNHHDKTEYIIQSLDEHILAMGKIKWEVENPSEGAYTFTLSPNSNRELLQITKSTIENSPGFEGWTFYYAKQANHEFSLKLYDAEMDIQEVNAENWQVVLIPADTDQFDLLLLADMDYLDEDTEMIAADLMLTNILGEERKINALSGLEIVDEFPPKWNDLSFPFVDLRSKL